MQKGEQASPELWLLSCLADTKTTIEEGNGNPLQCSCLQNPMDGGA